MLSDSVPPYYTDGPIREKSHGSEEFLRSYDYQLEELPKGTNWKKDPVTFHGASHPMYAPRFLGANSNVNRRKVHEQDDSQVDGNVFSGSVAFGFCTVWRCHEAGQHETGRQYETGRQHEERRHEEGQEVQEEGEEGRQHEAELAPACVLQVRVQGSWCGQYHRLP